MCLQRLEVKSQFTSYMVLWFTVTNILIQFVGKVKIKVCKIHLHSDLFQSNIDMNSS